MNMATSCFEMLSQFDSDTESDDSHGLLPKKCRGEALNWIKVLTTTDDCAKSDVFQYQFVFFG